MDIVVAILTTIIGAFLGLVVIKWDTWRETAKRADLRGEWIAISHGGDHKAVRDKICISRKRGKLYLQNIGNEFGYLYEAYCVVESYNLLHGTWRSLRSGSTLTGRVLMIIDPQGTSIGGVYTGKSKDGCDLILTWTMARDEKLLTEAIAQMRKSVGIVEID